MLAVGEVHTGLLCHSSALTSREAADALGLAPGEPVRRSERPIAYAVSPNRLTGVDCALATLSGARTRAVGTVVSHASLTGGHILQGSSWARVLRGTAGRRLPWSHYLFRPGVVETVGRCDPDDIARGHAGAELPAGSLDLGAMSVRMMDAVEWRAGPDKRPPFRVWRTRLRWAALPAIVLRSSNAYGPYQFPEKLIPLTIANASQGKPLPVYGDGLHVRDWVHVLDLCEAILEVLERSRIGSLSRREVILRLAPVVDHLLHLWMPGARLDSSMLGVWESIERRPGFTRQWQASVDRIRDQVAISNATLHTVVAEMKLRSA